VRAARTDKMIEQLVDEQILLVNIIRG